jgi:hypothetical protein
MPNEKPNKPQTADLQDSKADEQKLQPDEATLDLPDIEDIPGQEHVHVPNIRSMQDVTASSDDEEGKNIPGFNDDDDTASEDSDVTDEERELLQRSSESMGTEDDEAQRGVMLDNADDDGEPLNETVNASGSDLDVPGSEDDDDNEAIGEEDEENNNYSLGDNQ